MQEELETESPGTHQILAVNEVGFDSGIDTMAGLGDLPILQDTPSEDASDLWDTTYRDVYVLDGDGQFHAVFNLTTHGLGDADNFAALKELFIEAHESTGR